eukprot:1001182-Pyramimonas_sp.AAC.1
MAALRAGEAVGPGGVPPPSSARPHASARANSDLPLPGDPPRSLGPTLGGPPGEVLEVEREEEAVPPAVARGAATLPSQTQARAPQDAWAAAAAQLPAGHSAQPPGRQDPPADAWGSYQGGRVPVAAPDGGNFANMNGPAGGTGRPAATGGPRPQVGGADFARTPEASARGARSKERSQEYVHEQYLAPARAAAQE